MSKPTPRLPVFLSPQQVAEQLQVSTKTVGRWVTCGDLVAHRFGGQWRIADSDLAAFIALRRCG